MNFENSHGKTDSGPLLQKQVPRKILTETPPWPLLQGWSVTPAVVQGPAGGASNVSKQHSNNLNEQATGPTDMRMCLSLLQEGKKITKIYKM